MPRKIRELKADLRRAGFLELSCRGKGSHSYWTYTNLEQTLTLSGNDGDDAKAYPQRAVRHVMEAAKALRQEH